MHRKNPNRKFSLRFGKEETSTEEKRRRLRRLVPSWSFLTRLRRPYLVRLAGKDRGEKGRLVTFGACCILNSGGTQCFSLAFHSVVTLRMSWYAPPDTVGIKFAASCHRISAINGRCRPDSLVCTFLRGSLLCLPRPYKRQRPPMASPHRGRPFCCGGMQNGNFCPGSFLSRKNRV